MIEAASDYLFLYENWKEERFICRSCEKPITRICSFTGKVTWVWPDDKKSDSKDYKNNYENMFDNKPVDNKSAIGIRVQNIENEE